MTRSSNYWFGNETKTKKVSWRWTCALLNFLLFLARRQVLLADNSLLTERLTTWTLVSLSWACHNQPTLGKSRRKFEKRRSTSSYELLSHTTQYRFCRAETSYVANCHFSALKFKNSKNTRSTSLSRYVSFYSSVKRCNMIRTFIYEKTQKRNKINSFLPDSNYILFSAKR